MVQKSTIFFIAVLFVFQGATTIRAQEDVEGSRDHPLISRYEGSYIIGYEQRDYDALRMPAGPYDGEDTEMITPEGAVTRIVYAAPKGVSSLQVFRNYQLALQEAGFTEVYACKTDCRDFQYIFYDGPTALHNRGDLTKFALAFDRTENARYLLTRFDGPEGSVYVSVYSALFNGQYTRSRIKKEMKDRPVTLLQVVETKAMETGKVQVNADEMAKSLEQTGKVRLYGIHFETDEATIRESSETTLAEIAKLLNEHPGLELFVVGHTDATGSFDHNMELSEKRAAAVTDYLTGEKGIAGGRLLPHGVGCLAPVAGNDSPEDRALNRRVELVKKY